MSIQTAARDREVLQTVPDAGLQRHVLGETQVIAQAIGQLGPSVGAATLVPLAFANARGASWLTVLITTVGVFAVAYILAVLARRHVSPGALYTLIPKALGPAGGLLAAGAVGIVITAGMINPVLAVGATFAQFLTSALSIGHSGRAELLLFDLATLGLAATIVFRGIKLSTKVLLVLEITSMTVISVLLLIVLVKHGDIFDSRQLRLTGVSTHGMLVGISVIVLAFGGFESAASLGLEARNPRTAVPRALMGSILVAGAFFLVNSYIQILGFEGTGMSITSQSVPLGALATHYGVSWLGNVVLLGVTISWFAVTCAVFNYGTRIILAMTRDRVLPAAMGRTTAATGTPTVALACLVALCLAFLAYVAATGTDLTVAFDNVATFAGYGFTLGYLLLALGAVRYSFRHGDVRAIFLAAALVGGAVMVIEYWFSFNPFPPMPLRNWALGFVVFVAVLVLVTAVLLVRGRGWLDRIGATEDLSASAH